MSVREKRLVRMCLLYLESWLGDAEEYYLRQDIPSYVPNDFPYDLNDSQIDVLGKIMFAPTDAEMDMIVHGTGKGGNWRTQELISLAIAWAIESLDDIEQEFYYSGDSQRIIDADTHLTVEDVAILKPTEAELAEINVAEIVKHFPPVQLAGQRAWDVYDLVEDEIGQKHWTNIDTVFYDRSCDVEYVRNGLINHDGYSSSIIVIADH